MTEKAETRRVTVNVAFEVDVSGDVDPEDLYLQVDDYKAVAFCVGGADGPVRVEAEVVEHATRSVFWDDPDADPDEELLSGSDTIDEYFERYAAPAPNEALRKAAESYKRLVGEG